MEVLSLVIVDLYEILDLSFFRNIILDQFSYRGSNISIELQKDDIWLITIRNSRSQFSDAKTGL